MDDRSRNTTWIREDYLARRLQVRGYPVLLYVELTQNCNGACKMCRGKRSSYDAALDMKATVFNRLWEELFPFAAMVDLRGWGESTILRDFPLYLKRTLDTGVRVRLITNGLAITPGIWELLFSGDNVVGISIDSADPDLYRKLGRGHLERVLANLREGAAICKRSGKGLMYLKVVVSSFTLDGVPALVRLSADLGLPQIVLNPIRCPPGMLAHLSHVLHRIPAALDGICELGRRLGVRIRLGAAFDESLAVSSGLPDVCPNPWTHALVDYQGRVTSCDHLIGHAESVLGSVVGQPFQAIWNGQSFQDLRARHSAGPRKESGATFAKCNWCYRNRYLES